MILLNAEGVGTVGSDPYLLLFDNTRSFARY
jgi:hypothetical protein